MSCTSRSALVALLTDISILVDAIHQPQFHCSRLASKLYGELRKTCLASLGEFEAGKPKASLAKYSVKFNDFAVQMRPLRKTVFEAVRQTFHINVCQKSCWHEI